MGDSGIMLRKIKNKQIRKSRKPKENFMSLTTLSAQFLEFSICTMTCSVPSCHASAII